MPDNGDDMQIDSSSNPKGGEADESKYDVDQMDFFMNPKERERAQTYYK